ncbi:sigma 54-interacting transcriptional regulator [Henriciella mobilis]|uniref:DNA-binding transcriptional regulator NtrC n=1 Tax=Henriciella mobilis TaxID=2305467 RepID=A0A399REC1_9PROT|nr:sigma 54-interacting transcriptional regulator [Henriciella mobilis]RIJ15414.1 response regulator [Henriciella mobilis]RIJ18878.1 response regulator [Henriciella mobilis]RIJ28132.1 response regulator [Henriciella mobilis]
MSQKTILLAEDDASIRLVVNQTLVTAGYQVRATSSADALERWIRNGEGDVVVTDVYLGDTAIFELLPSIKLARPELPVIVMSGQNTILTAASAARHGVYDYLPKPFDIDQLTNLVGRALKGPPKKDAATRAGKGDAETNLPLIGRSDPMQEVYRIISRVMNTDLTVLIEGESGTGKELAARAIHQLGSGERGVFKALDLAAMPTEQISKDLFGTPEEPGLAFQEDATLYLDEIGDLPAEAQTQLVKLMREAGGARIIASTRQPLAKLVDNGDFREDLFYRINVVRIFMPPLRQRKEDIPELVRAFLLRAQRKGLAAKQIEPAAMDLMMAYDWPGNVRELENLIMRLAALSPDPVISQRDIERELRAEALKDISSNTSFEKEVETLLHRYIMADLLQASPDDSKIHQEVLEQVERPLIKLALSVTSGNKLRTAALLGVNRNTLRARINSLGLADD